MPIMPNTAAAKNTLTFLPTPANRRGGVNSLCISFPDKVNPIESQLAFRRPLELHEGAVRTDRMIRRNHAGRLRALGAVEAHAEVIGQNELRRFQQRSEAPGQLLLQEPHP